MILGRAAPGLRLNSLGWRLATLLTLAILPLGLIVAVQTWRVIDESRQRIEVALQGEALRATRPERAVVQQTIGATRALGLAIRSVLDDPVACRAILGRYVEETPTVRSLIFVPPSGVAECTSGDGLDFRDWPELEAVMAAPRLQLRRIERARLTGEPSIMIQVPLMAEDGTFLGFTVSAVHYDALAVDIDRTSDLVPIEILTFNEDGNVLTSSLGRAAHEERLPQNRSLKALVGGGPYVFRDADRQGRDWIYTVAPMVEDTAYAMAIWPLDVGFGGGLWRWTVPTIIVPFLMWVTSLMVAFFAVHRLVIRHIRRLRKRMRLFSRFRRIEEDAGGNDTLPVELREVTDSFVTMALTILRDEAEQEDSIREKDALLREIYHRVRNNLQLIASINNMQIRTLRSQEAKHVLRRLQDRIMALATIHGALYEANTLSKVRADRLVDELAAQASLQVRNAEVPATVESETDPVMLHPDQAVPLALFVVEALSNAIKHLQMPENGARPRVSIRLSERADQTVHLVIENTITNGAVVDFDNRANGGLGLDLMNAFVTQLGGQKHVHHTATLYRLEVVFHAMHYGEEAAIA
jgi:two-component sensor histidine kinase